MVIQSVADSTKYITNTDANVSGKQEQKNEQIYMKNLPRNLSTADTEARAMIQRAQQITENEQCEIDEVLDIFEEFIDEKIAFGENCDGTVFLSHPHSDGVIENVRTMDEYEPKRQSVFVNDALNSYTYFDENGNIIEKTGVKDGELYSYNGTVKVQDGTIYQAAMEQHMPENEILYSEKYVTENCTTNQYVIYDADTKKIELYLKETTGKSGQTQTTRMEYGKTVK